MCSSDLGGDMLYSSGTTGRLIGDAGHRLRRDSGLVGGPAGRRALVGHPVQHQPMPHARAGGGQVRHCAGHRPGRNHRTSPDKPALIMADTGQTVSYRELDEITATAPQSLTM